MDANYAVFTGDLIGSTKSTEDRLNQTIQTLSGAAAFVEFQIGQNLRFTRNRGDGWQICLTDVSQTWFTLVHFLASLKAHANLLTTRISIAIGPVESVGTKDLSDARGTAFTLSGHALDAMQKMKRKPRKTQGDDLIGLQASRYLSLVGLVELTDIAILEFIEHLSRGWTIAQAQALLVAISNPTETQNEMAARLNISRQALNARLEGAGYSPINRAIWANRLVSKEGANA